MVTDFADLGKSQLTALVFFAKRLFRVVAIIVCPANARIDTTTFTTGISGRISTVFVFFALRDTDIIDTDLIGAFAVFVFFAFGESFALVGFVITGFTNSTMVVFGAGNAGFARSFAVQTAFAIFVRRTGHSHTLAIFADL